MQSDVLTDNERLALVNAQQAITIAQQQHQLVVLQIRALHGLSPSDTIAPDGTIVRAPEPEHEAPGAAPDVTTTPAEPAEETPAP